MVSRWRTPPLQPPSPFPVGHMTWPVRGFLTQYQVLTEAGNQLGQWPFNWDYSNQTPTIWEQFGGFLEEDCGSSAAYESEPLILSLKESILDKTAPCKSIVLGKMAETEILKRYKK